MRRRGAGDPDHVGLYGTRHHEGGRGRTGGETLDRGTPPPLRPRHTHRRRGHRPGLFLRRARRHRPPRRICRGAGPRRDDLHGLGLSGSRRPVAVHHRPVRAGDAGRRRVADGRPLRHPRLPHPCRPVRPALPRLVPGLPRGGRHRLLPQGRRGPLPRLARRLVSLRPGGADRPAHRARPGRAHLVARRTPAAPRRRGRRRRAGGGTDPLHPRPVRFGRDHLRHLRRPHRRSFAGPCGPCAESTTLSNSPAAPASISCIRAADLGGKPHSRHAEEAVGAAGRHPPVRPHQQAALPPALLFLHRQGAVLDVFDSRSPTGTW
jgi:hypothetical protein